MLETRKFFLKQGVNRIPCGSFELSVNFGKLRPDARYNLLRSALRREAHFRSYPVTGMALYDAEGRMVVPKQPQPQPDDSFVQEVKFIYHDLFGRKYKQTGKGK